MNKKISSFFCNLVSFGERIFRDSGRCTLAGMCRGQNDRFGMAGMCRGQKRQDSAGLKCVVVKKSDSACPECVVVKNIRFSMSGMCHAKINDGQSLVMGQTFAKLVDCALQVN
jgi:hypothetical protein